MENELLKRYKIIKEYSKTINVFLEIPRTHSLVTILILISSKL
jgi:hypothetical protein